MERTPAPGDRLDDLRRQIEQLDHSILALVRDRLSLATQIAKEKLSTNQPIQQPDVEFRVVERYRSIAKTIGLDQEQATVLSRQIIEWSCDVQRDSIQSQQKISKCDADTICVIGGAGSLGSVVVQTALVRGHCVRVCDHNSPTAQHQNLTWSDNLRESIKSADVIFLTVPMTSVSAVIRELILLETDALVVDVSSIKSPMLTAFSEARSAGLHITSCHPMFGPETPAKMPRYCLVCNTGDDLLDERIEALARHFDWHTVRIGLDEHDSWMSVALGLPMLINFAFATTESKLESEFTQQSALTSLPTGSSGRSQRELAARVLRSSFDLLFDIQVLNFDTAKVLSALQEQLNHLTRAIEQNDRTKFKELLQSAVNHRIGSNLGKVT